MSLPACEQRVLDRIEGSLRASEPKLSAMYAMFARLNAGEPVGSERLGRRRLARCWLQPGSAAYAIVLIPVMFAAIVVGALLGGGSRGVSTCEASYSVGGVSPLAGGRPACQAPARARAVQAARKTVSATARLACSVSPARFAGPAAESRAFPAALWLENVQAARLRAC